MKHTGPSPTPTALKLLKGNPGRRPLNKEEAKLPAGKLPTCPAELSPNAKKEWKRVSKLLFQAGLLTQIDRAALAGYCTNYAHWIESEVEVQKTGTIVKTKDGYPIINPYLAVSRRAFDQMNKVLQEFGMTPASRSRIQVQPPEQESDPMDKWRKRG